MHPIQERLLDLSKSKNLAEMTLRQMAAEIGMPKEAPQKVKHHLLQLEKRGFLSIDRDKKTMARTAVEPGWVGGMAEGSADLFHIPVVGSATCGPATIFAEENFEGFLRVSARLVGLANPDALYAIRADGSSMNRAIIGGRVLEDGDYAIVDSRRITPRDNQVVVGIIENKAVIKRFIRDIANNQIVLQSDSTFDYEPIFLHPEDEFLLSGTVVAVIKRPAKKRQSD